MLKTTVLVVLAAVLLSCDDLPVAKSTSSGPEKEKFEMKQDKDGRTVRLNKVTGDMAILNGSTLVPVQSPEDAQRNANTIAVLAQKRVWPPTSIPQISKETVAYLATSWRDGRLYYQFSVTPSAPLRSAISRGGYGNFEVKLTDAGGFTLIRIPISLSRFTRIVDDEGKVSYYEADESVAASQDVYRSLESYSLTWNF